MKAPFEVFSAEFLYQSKVFYRATTTTTEYHQAAGLFKYPNKFGTSLFIGRVFVPTAEHNAVSQITLYFVMNGGCPVTCEGIILVKVPAPQPLHAASH